MKYRYVSILALLAIPLTEPARADTRSDVLAGMARCGDIADNRTWLDCVYGAAQPMRALLGLAPASSSQTRLVPSALSRAPFVRSGRTEPQQPTYQGRQSGLFARVFGNSGRPLILKIPMTSYEFDGSGMFTATLTNGEVWTQIGSNDAESHAHWRGAASHYLVTITPGAMGTFNLVVSGEERLYKVHRVR
jgi:hypothetical protein